MYSRQCPGTVDAIGSQKRSCLVSLTSLLPLIPQSMTFYLLACHPRSASTALFSTGLSPTSCLAPICDCVNVTKASLLYTPHSLAFLKALFLALCSS